jgi:CoA:oxalate CoA-transferase
MREGALAGLKVLDLSHYIAGPYCTKLLGALGASVIKLERPNGGDPMRRVGPFFRDEPGLERSCPFMYLNTDKQSITLNLKSPTGVNIFHEVLAWADVLVESFRPGVMDRLGLSYETLENRKPNLVMVSISNFGQTGPYRDFSLTDLTAQALGGVMNEMGEPDGMPLKLGGYQALYSAGVAGFTAAMTGVMARKIAGVGQHVDVSILEMMAYTEWHASCQYTYNGQVRKRQGRYNPWKILKAKDGHMAVVGQWPQIQSFLSDEVPNDERFKTPAGRLEHTLEMGELVEAALIKHEKVDLYHRGQAAGVPWGYVADMDDVLDSPQYGERQFFRELDHPVAGRGSYAGQPFRIGDLPFGPWSPAPMLGQHNQEVYGRLFGCSSDELVRLHQMGII